MPEPFDAEEWTDEILDAPRGVVYHDDIKNALSAAFEAGQADIADDSEIQWLALVEDTSSPLTEGAQRVRDRLLEVTGVARLRARVTGLKEQVGRLRAQIQHDAPDGCPSYEEWERLLVEEDGYLEPGDLVGGNL